MDFEPTQQQIEGAGSQFEATQLQLANLHDDDDEDFQATQMQPAGSDFNATQAQTEEEQEEQPAATEKNEETEKNTDSPTEETAENKEGEEGGVNFDEEEDAPAKPKSAETEKAATPEDEDDEDINEAEIKKNTEKLKGKRKKRKEAGEGGEKQKRKKRRGGGDESFKMDDEDESAPANKQSNAEEGDEFEQILRKADVKKARFTSDKYETTAKTTAADFLEKMRNAVIQDIKAYDQGSLALNKLELLPEVMDKCAKLYLQPPLIEQGILNVLEDWITPLSKGTLPDLNIRTGVLKVLMDLPLKTDASAQFEGGIEAEDLAKCGIASKVKMLANHPKEIPTNKKVASTLVERWSRLFYGLSDNYKDASPIAAPKTVPRKPKPKPVEAAQQGPSRRARIPKKEGFDFTIDPKAVFKEVPKQEAKENTVQKRLSRKLSELRKPSRKKFV